MLRKEQYCHVKSSSTRPTRLYQEVLTCMTATQIYSIGSEISCIGFKVAPLATNR